jgi:hypothetical protein
MGGVGIAVVLPWLQGLPTASAASTTPAAGEAAPAEARAGAGAGTPRG